MGWGWATMRLSLAPTNQPTASGSFHLISVPLLGLLWGHARLAGGGYCLLLLGLVSKLLPEGHCRYFTIPKKHLFYWTRIGK